MHIANIFFIGIIIFLLLVTVGKFTSISNPIVKVPESIFISAVQSITSHVQGVNGTISNQTFNQEIIVPKINQGLLVNYTLQLINRDREANGLGPVSLSTEPSAQQHAQSMLAYDYFSHWDLYGMKPYMRYTLSGGTGAVSENIAYVSSRYCVAGICTGSINPNESLAYMEYSMMNNDSACCNNGHRDNILDPNHNEVSIGVAYNNSDIYLVQDFIDNYVAWTANTPAYSNAGEMRLEGQLAQGYGLSQIYVAYDAPVQNLTSKSAPAGPYGYGQDIAGVVKNSAYYYSNLTTIVADSYTASGGRIDVSFNMSSIVQRYGAGEYTILLFLDKNQGGSSFVGSDYTVFINANKEQYTPVHV